MNITDDMFEAGQKKMEANASTFWFSSRDKDAWRWFLSEIYTSMRELEPEPKKGK